MQINNSSGAAVAKFVPIWPGDSRYDQGAMTIQDILVQAAGVNLPTMALGAGIGIFGKAAPTAQFSTTGTTTGFTAGSSTAVLVDSTFTGNSGTTAYTISDVVLALKNMGILKG